MKAVILAGGLGTRLRPITYEIPKPLLPVKKKPILNHLIDFFHRYDISEIAVLLSRSHEEDFKKWREVWRDQMPDHKIYLFYEEEPRGTFGGMRLLKDWLGNETFVFSNGDELKDFNLYELCEAHENQGGVATIALVEVPNPEEYGVPILEGNKIVEFLNKPENLPSNLISSGLYVLDPKIFDYADFSKDYLMIEHDIFTALAREGKLAGYKPRDYKWFPCDNLEKWEKAIKEW